ncbi:MAG TPA: cobalt-precorrin-6A reductase [Coleofasciculaceae cyanobacterium]|jgi:precorrin-6A/cobalt-precorrin-6A reductase
MNSRAEKTRVLILGGTGDAVELAAQASAIPQLEVMTSLAGRTRQPSTPVGNSRVGGFGGATGLTTYLQAHSIDLLIDATHPFAAQISWNAAIAAAKAHIPHLMLVRPMWQKAPGDRWIEVDSVEAAAATIPEGAKRVFLTIGRQQLAPFVPLHSICFLIRSIDPPEPPLPPGKILLDRGPFSLEQERSLLQDYQIDAIVSKNSGGDATYAKVIAARERDISIVMVQRPAMPVADRVSEVDGALDWLKQQASKL